MNRTGTYKWELQDGAAKSARRHRQGVAASGIWITLVLVLAMGPAHVALAADKVPFDIPRGPATRTLTEFAAQSGLQVLFGYDDVQGIETNAVQGTFEVTAALATMVKGTRLEPTFPYPDAVTVTVRPSASVRTPGTERRTDRTSPEPWPDRRSLISPVDEVTIRATPDRPSIGQLGSQLITMTRDDIDSHGVATIQDVLRTVPQIFGGGPSEDTKQGFEARTNVGSGWGVNLRGLGAGSTLVLLNGRRLSGSGTDGIFVDISNLPLSLVERIEILPDSSSTRYGADAVGGVVNFVLKDSLAGTQTDAFFGAATQSALHEGQVSQMVGMNWRKLRGLLALDYYDRQSLPAEDRRQARSDLTMFGGDNFDTPQSNPGTILFTTPTCSPGSSVCTPGAPCVPGTPTCTLTTYTWAIPAGQDGAQLSPSGLISGSRNLENLYSSADLLPTQRRLSLYGTGSAPIDDYMKVFGDIFYGERDVHAVSSGVRATLAVPKSNAFFVNPTGQPVTALLVGYDFTDDLGLLTSNGKIKTSKLVGGFDLEPDQWHISVTADFASEKLGARLDNDLDTLALPDALKDDNRATALNVFGDGSHTNPATLAGLRTSLFFNSDSKIWSSSLAVSRPLPIGRHSAGTIMGGIDWRRQFLSSRTGTLAGIQSSRDVDRSVRAAFIAASVPILNQIELSLGGRYENYSDFGASRSPRLGLTWMPFNSLAVRGTYSKSLRPPNLFDLDESGNVVEVVPVRDPNVPGGLAQVLVQSGKNSHLREERAENWTVGVDFEPASIPTFSLGLTYFDTNFRDRMNVPTFSQNLLADPAMQDLIIRNPTTAQLEEACRSGHFTGSQSSCSMLPVTAVADLRIRNSAFVHTNGFDLLAQYTPRIGSDSLVLGVGGTYILSFKNAEAPGSIAIERVSTQSNPIDLRLQGSIEWRHRDWTTSMHVNYADGYRDTASVRQRRVASWTTLDMRIAYSVNVSVQSWLNGTMFALSAENVFDTDPPFLNNQVGIGYDQENADLTGRILSISLRKKW